MWYVVFFVLCTFSATAGKSAMDSILLNLKSIETEVQFKSALEKWDIKYETEDVNDGKEVSRHYNVDSCFLGGIYFGRGLFNFQLGKSKNNRAKKEFRLNEFIVTEKSFFNLLPKKYSLIFSTIVSKYGDPMIKGPMLELDVFDWEAETLFVKYPVDRTMWQVSNKFFLSLSVNKESVALVYFLK